MPRRAGHPESWYLLCSICGQGNDRAGRHAYCSDCWADYMRAYREKKRREKRESLA